MSMNDGLKVTLLAIAHLIIKHKLF